MLLEPNKKRLSVIKYNNKIQKKSIFTDEEKMQLLSLYQDLKSNTEDFIHVSKYINFLKALGNKDRIYDCIIYNLEKDEDKKVNFDQFLDVLENAVGVFNEKEGLKTIYSFLTFDKDIVKVNKENLLGLSKELGIELSGKKAQLLIDFMSVKHNSESFNFEDFKTYFLKETLN